MADIFHQVGIKTSIEHTYTALTSLNGLSAWWTKCTGETGIGNQLYFHFGEHVIEMTIEELNPRQKVVWRCSEKEGEWKDTLISYNLLATDEQVFINFSHTLWAEQSDLCSHCSTKWAVFLISLKNYLETGAGQPFPNDIQINHHDG